MGTINDKRWIQINTEHYTKYINGNLIQIFYSHVLRSWIIGWMTGKTPKTLDKVYKSLSGAKKAVKAGKIYET